MEGVSKNPPVCATVVQKASNNMEAPQKHTCEYSARQAMDNSQKSSRWEDVSDKDTGHANPLDKDDYVKLRVARMGATAVVLAALIYSAGHVLSSLIDTIGGK